MMPATRRRFTWQHDPDEPRDAEFLAAQCMNILNSFCAEWPQWFSDPEVTGFGFGVLQFAVTVESRDQWWVAKRAKRVLAAVQAFTEVPITLVSEVSVSRLPPHDHRGRRWLEENRGSPARNA